MPIYPFLYCGIMCGLFVFLVACLLDLHTSHDRREQITGFGGALGALAIMLLLLLLAAPRASGMEIAGGPVIGNVPEVPDAACKGDPTPVLRSYYEITVGGTVYLPVVVTGEGADGRAGSELSVQQLPAGLAHPHFILERIDALDDGVCIVSGSVGVRGTAEGLWIVRVRCTFGKSCTGVVQYEVRVHARPVIPDPAHMRGPQAGANVEVQRHDDEQQRDPRDSP